MEPVEAARQFIWNRLTQDSALQALFGGTVRLENVWVTPDQTFPYMVYRFRRTNDGPIAAAIMTLDFWDFADTGQRITDVIERVSNLLDWINYNGADGFIRIRKDLEVEIQEDERYYWHTTSEWLVRLTRDTEIAGSILGG